MIAAVWPTAIPLRERDGSVGAYALVDSDVYSELSRHRWCSSKGYAVRQADKRMRYLHREVAGNPATNIAVDHINRNKVDNRRSNLRRCTKAQDCQNKPLAGTGTSGFRGVSFDRTRNRWKAYAQLDSQYIHIGRFREELEAAQAASDWRKEHMPYSNEPEAVAPIAA